MLQYLILSIDFTNGNSYDCAYKGGQYYAFPAVSQAPVDPSALPAAILLLLAARNSDSPNVALHPYAFLSKVGNAVTGIFPFSLAEILVILFLIGVPVALIWFLIHFFRSKGRRGVVLGKGLLNLLCLASVLLLLFTLNCGINYNRTPSRKPVGWNCALPPQKELTDLSHHLAEKLNELRPLVKEDENGVMISSFSSLPRARGCRPGSLQHPT